MAKVKKWRPIRWPSEKPFRGRKEEMAEWDRNMEELAAKYPSMETKKQAEEDIACMLS